MPPIHDFLRALDQAWRGTEREKIPLQIIGSTALMLQADYERGTKDSDVLETNDLRGEISTQLIALAGPGTELHKHHKLYIELVSSGLPLLPQRPAWLKVPDLNTDLTHFRVDVLHVVDVVVSKLKRFHGGDIQDIEAMIDLGLVPHEQLLDRFRSAIDLFLFDSRATDIPKYLRNLNRVERDMLGVAETRIELPSWLDSDED